MKRYFDYYRPGIIFKLKGINCLFKVISDENLPRTC